MGGCRNELGIDLVSVSEALFCQAVPKRSEAQAKQLCSFCLRSASLLQGGNQVPTFRLIQIAVEGKPWTQPDYPRGGRSGFVFAS